jgi:hypothetical protein
MWFAYLDESKENNSTYIYSALIIRGEAWPKAFGAVKEFRKELRRSKGIYLAQEMHAWKFIAGKGKISDRVIGKVERAEIFASTLDFIASCKYFRLFSSINSNELYAFERLINRINRTAEKFNEHVVLFCDSGQEVEFTRRIRRMRVVNHISSNLGQWQDNGSSTKNIPIERFVEDPVFKDSKGSYFIQLVDFCSYALLRMERPIESKSKLGFDTMYARLEPIVAKFANPRDPRHLGIIR